MKLNFKKIAKTGAVGVFFMALLMNVKVSLTDPFVSLSNDALAQTNSSSSTSSSTSSDVPCKDVENPGYGDNRGRICVKYGSSYCKFDWYDLPATIGECHFN